MTDQGRPFPLRVETRDEGRAAESVRCLHLGGRTVQVRETVDRWIGPDHRYFKVVGEDGALYLLRQDENRDQWELIQYKRDPQG